MLNVLTGSLDMYNSFIEVNILPLKSENKSRWYGYKSFYKDRDILFVLRDEDEVRDLQPDMELISKLDGACVAVTAKGTEYDCVSRVFVPKYGINEDPVTGSTHCMIAPYWSRRLNKPDITAFQASKRTGILYCECIGDKVIISGKAILFSINDIVSL